jgi:hypothetical protein
MVALDPSLKDLTKSSISGLPKTSSTLDSTQAVQLNPKTANPENPFLFSYTRSSADPASTKNRKDFVTTKNQLSIKPKPHPYRERIPYNRTQKVRLVTLVNDHMNN